MRRGCLVLLGCALACSDAPPPDSTGFDATAVFEVFDRDVRVGDATFDGDVVTLFRTQDVLPDLEVTALTSLGDTVYAGTAGGLMRLADGGAAFVAVPEVSGRVVDLVRFPGGFVAAEAHALHVLDDDGAHQRTVATTSTVTAVGVVSGQFLVGTAQALLHLDEVGAVTTTVALAEVRDVYTTGNRAFVATADGVHEYNVSQRRVNRVFRAPELLDDDVRAIAYDGLSREMWFGTAEGIAALLPDGTVEARAPGLESGLPNGDVRALHAATGVFLSGHGVGANAWISDRVEHYHSLRWLPDEAVTAVTVDQRGQRWVGTAAGVSRLTTAPTTLAARAEINEGYLQDRHWRMDGFVDDRISVADEWTLEGIRTGDHDNDGLWTEMQIGAWCYAYAVTGEPRYYASARKALDVMFLQIDVPGATFAAAGRPRGFITRSLVRDDEGEVFEEKAAMSNWHRQAYEGRTYYWKDDTSSDEYAGHYFGIPLFYDLCAQDDAERAEIADYLRLTTDYLIDHDYELIDLDGEPTLHGHWDDLAVGLDGVDACVDRLGLERAQDCLSSRHGGGWLNGTEILGHLLAAWHVTQDPKYFDEYERLFTDERYGELVQVTDETFTVTRPAIANHSDHELAMLAYITLLRYEPHPERRRQYVESLLAFYEYEREEHNPWQVGVIAGAYGGEVDTDGALRTLRDMPLDWRTWRYDNGHRQDALRGPTDRHGEPQFTRVFPYDEIRTMKWNGSPYRVAAGSSGRGVLAPTPYLLAYWTLRYHRVLD